jgi:hypothetical protein
MTFIWREGPAISHDLLVAGRIERRLQVDVERTGTDAAAFHGAKDLDVADRINDKPP